MNTNTRTACSAHTPGPWTYRAEDALIIAPNKLQPKNNWHIAYLRPQGVETPANAALIAAAPDMLAVLQQVAAHFEGTDAPLGIAARAAIAKAEGQS